VESSLAESFRPPKWLRSPHLQSVLPSLSVRRAFVERRAAPLLAAAESVLLDCGDGVRLQCFHSRPAGDERSVPPHTVVLLHGWEGSADSLYVLSPAQRLFELGFDVVRLNLRDHGATHHLNRELFHSCRLPEVLGALRSVRKALPGQPMSLIGFSLGGNFMLRAAARAADAGLEIERVIAVSPVLDPTATLVALESGWSAYHSYFVRKWSRSLLKKQAAWPGHYDFDDLLRGAGLRRMTAELVRRFTEYPSLEEYLDGYAITGGALSRLEVPSHLITALDDPIIPALGLERVARPKALRVTTARHGGHCGFVERLGGPSWTERLIVDELAPRRLTGAA
jgi:predicted alpha/beta-fold hydrolase